MLGTNDLKTEFNRSVEEIAQATQQLVELIQDKTEKYSGTSARILLVSPILIDSDAPMHKEWYSDHYDTSSLEKSKELAVQLERVAKTTGRLFVDAVQVARAGKDGVHFDEASHGTLGELLAHKINDQ